MGTRRFSSSNQFRTRVDLMYHAGGGASVYSSSPLQRCFRDLHVVSQHHQITSRNYEILGRLMLGLETDTSLL